MATQPQDILEGDNTLELGTDELIDAGDTGGGEQGDDDAPEPEPQDELEYPSFDDGTEERDDDTPRMKEMRALLRDTLAENKRLQQGTAPKPVIEVGPEPTLDDPDIEWDQDKFKARWTAWHARKQEADAAGSEAEQLERKRTEDLAGVVRGYTAKKDALPFADKEEMLEQAFLVLSGPQKEIMLRVASDPAKLGYALARNPSKLNVLASLNVTDMASVASFAAAITKLDGELKMTKRRPNAQPDRAVRGSAPLSSASGDKEEQRLEAEARRTNDRSKLIAYRAGKRPN